MTRVPVLALLLAGAGLAALTLGACSGPIPPPGDAGFFGDTGGTWATGGSYGTGGALYGTGGFYGTGGQLAGDAFNTGMGAYANGLGLKAQAGAAPWEALMDVGGLLTSFIPGGGGGKR